MLRERYTHTLHKTMNVTSRLKLELKPSQTKLRQSLPTDFENENIF